MKGRCSLTSCGTVWPILNAVTFVGPISRDFHNIIILTKNIKIKQVAIIYIHTMSTIYHTYIYILVFDVHA